MITITYTTPPPDSLPPADIAAELIRFAEAADCDPEDIERVRAKVRRVEEGETGRESA